MDLMYFSQCKSIEFVRTCGGRYSKQQYSDHFVVFLSVIMSTFRSVFADLIGKFGTPVTEELTKDNYSVKEIFCEDLCDNSDIDFNLICATRYIFNQITNMNNRNNNKGMLLTL